MANANDDRIIGCILGSLIADAAVHPVHWVYNAAILDEALKDDDSPEFRDTILCPFYFPPKGSMSCYADQAYVLLKSMVHCKGLDIQHFMAETAKHFGPGTDYGLPNPSSKQDMPKKSGLWCNSNVLRSLENMRNGVEPSGGNTDDIEADCVSKIIPVVAFYHGTNKLDEMVEKVIRVTQNNDTAVQFGVAFGRLLEQIILTSKPLSELIPGWVEALKESSVECRNAMTTVLETKDLPHVEAARKYGVACALPGNFQGTIHALLTCDNYTNGVRQTLRGGGGNCSRASCVGAGFGARDGVDVVPLKWIEKTANGQEILSLAKQLVQLRNSTQ